MVLLALLVATTVAFALTEALKLERSPVTRPKLSHVFSPTCTCPRTTARLAFQLRTRETVDAWIVDSDGKRVRVLAEASRRDAGRVVFRWDGRDDDGAVLADGGYRLRLYLARGQRTIVIPKVVRVDTRPPEVELVSVAPRRLSPDGDGRADTAAVVYRSSERARPLVSVGGDLALAGPARAHGTATVVWDGTVAEKPLGPGLYPVTVQAEDAAGNVSEPSESIAVHIRYIELVPAFVEPRRGVLHVRVLTDARGYEWKLFRRGRAARPVAFGGPLKPGAAALRLPPSIHKGRYVLRVSANRHSDSARVIVPRSR